MVVVVVVVRCIPPNPPSRAPAWASSPPLGLALAVVRDFWVVDLVVGVVIFTDLGVEFCPPNPALLDPQVARRYLFLFTYTLLSPCNERGVGGDFLEQFGSERIS